MPISGAPLEQPFYLPDLLRHGLENKPDDVALVSTATTRTWRQLDEVARRLATSYLDLGLKPGDRVASLMPNRASLIVHYVACLKAGLVATPLNYRYMAPEIDHALSVSGASLLLVHVERADDVAASELAGRLPLGLVTFSDDEEGHLSDATIGDSPSYKALVDPSRPLRELPDPAPEAPAIIYFTSGSTGKPKGVVHTHETLGWNLACFHRSYSIGPDDIFLPGCSCSHVGGSLCSLASLSAGARVDVLRDLTGRQTLRLLRDTGTTILVMLPAALFGLVRDHDAKPADFSTLRYCISGGDKVSAELEQEFHKVAGFNVTEGYGMTEIGFATRSAFSWEPDAQGPVADGHHGSVGRLCAGYQAEVRDENGQEVAPGAEGRLWIKFPGNTIGYWENPVATAETIVDGWFDTGDVMALDEAGYFWFRGRKKQIIIHDGSNICPQEVEEAVLAHPAVALAGVVGVHNLVHGENVRAYITLVPGAPRPSDDDLIAFARARVGYKAPEEIVVLDEMPLNATGKVHRLLLKEMAAKEHAPREL